MDKNLLERVIKRLEEKDLVDHEVMDADDLGALRSDITELKKLLPNDGKKLYKTTVKYIETYEIYLDASCEKEAEELARCLYRSGELLLKSQILYAEAEL